MTSDNRIPEPVFIVGMNGSGTSMMLDSLGRHPELYAIPHETLMMPYIISKAGRFGDLSNEANFRKYARFAIDQMPVLRRLNGGARLELPADWRRWPRTIEGVFDGIFSAFAGKGSKARWCEKTPDHVEHLRLLAKIFPQARFIHVIRDGREVARSVNRRQARQPELIMYRWKKLVARGRAEGAELGPRYLELRYEDLTRDAAGEMKRVCRFLGIGFADQVLLSRMPQNPGKKKLSDGELGRISYKPVMWPSYFDKAMVKRLEAIGGAMLQKLSYDVCYEAGDRDPGRLMRRVWRARDFARLTMRRIGARNRSLAGIARSVAFSIKQYRLKDF